MAKRFHQYDDVDALAGGEILLVAVLSSDIVYTASTISAVAATNSFHDSAGGFLDAGFAAGLSVNDLGFTGTEANNKKARVILSVTATDMVFAGTDGDDIVDEAEGDSITLTVWTPLNATVLQLRGSMGDHTDSEFTDLAEDDVPRWDGTKWVNSQLSPISMGMLSDANMPSPTDGDVVMRVGGEWVNTPLGDILTAGYQPLDEDLTAFAGLDIAADKLPYGTGSHTLGLADFTAAGRALLDDADAAAQRTTLGLGTAATLDYDTDGTMAANSDAYAPTQKAARTFIEAKVAALVASAPGTLDTLDELAAALGDDPNLATTLTTAIGLKETAANKDASGGYAGLTLFKLNLRNAANTITSWFTTAATVARTWTMPDKDGTVAMTSDITGTNSGVNTGDQSTITGNAGTATTLQTSRNIDGQAFNGSADITVIAPGTHAATSKATPVDADEFSLVDSADSNLLKKLTWANLKATLKTYFDTLYQVLNANLTTIAGLTATTNNFLVSVAGAWASRTPAQAAVTLQGDGTSSSACGTRGVVVSTHSANYTAVASDAGTCLEHPASDANARTFTIDSVANQNWDGGTTLSFKNETSQLLTIAVTTQTLTLGGVGTTGSRTLAQYGIATAHLNAAKTTWLLTGIGVG